MGVMASDGERSIGRINDAEVWPHNQMNIVGKVVFSISLSLLLGFGCCSQVFRSSFFFCGFCGNSLGTCQARNTKDETFVRNTCFRDRLCEFDSWIWCRDTYCTLDCDFLEVGSLWLSGRTYCVTIVFWVDILLELNRSYLNRCADSITQKMRLI